MLTLLNLLGANHFKKGTCAEQVKFFIWGHYSVRGGGEGGELELIRLAWYAILLAKIHVWSRIAKRAVPYFSLVLGGGGGGGGGESVNHSLSNHCPCIDFV